MIFDSARLPRPLSAGDSAVPPPIRFSSLRDAAPAERAQRIELLNVLSGFGLFGTLMTGLHGLSLAGSSADSVAHLVEKTMASSVGAPVLAFWALLLGAGWGLRMRGMRGGRAWLRMARLSLTGLACIALPWWSDGRVAVWALCPLLIGMAMGQTQVLQQSVAHRGFWGQLLAMSLVFCMVPLLVASDGVQGDGLYLRHQGAALALGLFCMAACVLMFQQAAWRHWLCKLAPLGRMTLTNGLMQALLMLGLSQVHIGSLGIDLGLPGTIACGLAIFALQALFSCRWSARHRMGPVEGLWQRIVRGRPLSI